MIRMVKRNCSYFFLFLLVMLLDGQMTTTFSNFFSLDWKVNSHLLLILFLFASLELAELELFIQTFLLGFLYDLYYLDMIGVMIFMFPIISLALASVNDILLYSPWTRLFSILILTFTFEMVVMGLGIFLGRANFSLSSFIIVSLVPTIIFNLILFMILQPIFKKFHLI